MRSEFTANYYLANMRHYNAPKPRFTQRPRRSFFDALLSFLGHMFLAVFGLCLFAGIGLLLAWRG